jgi:F420-dependent oxidoreductase-like protein
MSFRLSYQIPFFNHAVPVIELFPLIAAQAQAAEAAGFDMITVMDHLCQPPLVGRPEEPILEAYTTLAALSAVTQRVLLSVMVTSNTYRNPAVLAKTVTTLDVVSGGRAVLGIGAGWFELEHSMYGLAFDDRFDRLAEALEIIVPMLRGERPDFEGKWYRSRAAVNEPRIWNDLPVLIGGGGERKTFSLAARHADYVNILSSVSELPGKVAAVRARCIEAGRDPESLSISFATPMMIDEDGDLARRQLRDFVLRSGIDLDDLTDRERAVATDRYFVGSPDEVSARVQAKVLDCGVTGLAVNLLAKGDDLGTIRLAGQSLAPLISAARVT